MTFLTRKTLTRRTMLKGMGASVALPLLDAMMPGLSAQAAARPAPMRLGFVYAAHGVIHSEWKPRQTGRQYELPPNLEPLAGVRDHFNIFTNLSHREADSNATGEPSARGDPMANTDRGDYRDNKDAILKLYDDTPGLDARYRNDAKNWLTQWFKLLESPRDAKWMFKDNCVVAPGV